MKSIKEILNDHLHELSECLECHNEMPIVTEQFDRLYRDLCEHRQSELDEIETICISRLMTDRLMTDQDS